MLQRWLVVHGHPYDVVIGVARSGGDFQAHAWLEYEPDAGARYEEIVHVPPTGDTAVPVRRLGRTSDVSR